MPSTESASNRPGSPYPVRPIEESEFDAFLAVDEHAFHGSPLSDGDRNLVLERFEFDRSLAAFDGTAPVGVTMCFSFQLSVPGGDVLPAAGVTFVAVLPTHRRRGDTEQPDAPAAGGRPRPGRAAGRSCGRRNR